jgi:hypothetical protein
VSSAAAAAPDNPVRAENRRPGTADWLLARPASAREIEGYASACSVNTGESIQLFVNTAASEFTLEVFRLGWYAGLGARRAFGPLTLPGRQQAMPVMDPASGLIDCDWVASCTLQTRGADDDAGWPSGVYLVRLTAAGSGAQSYIVFVVRDDQRAAELLVQLPFTTYQAYNGWGGKSLYHWGSSDGERASAVSFNRPYAANAQNPAAAGGMGAGELLTNVQPHPERYGPPNAGWDINMLRWLEREGFDASYGTNLDTHAAPPSVQRHNAWLSIGHDEYWSSQMRRHVEAARDAGLNLGFFSANTAYWQVRLQASPATGAADRVMVCHKKAKRDRDADGDAARVTDKFRSAAVGRPEEQLIGVMYTADPVQGDIVVRDAGHWAFAGTGLKPGERLSGLLGYEVDCVQGGLVPGLSLLAESPWTAMDDPTRQGVAHMSVYTAPSGATVFAAGTIQWAWGLDDFNVPALRTSRLNPAAQQITRNVLARLRRRSSSRDPT